jgi:site-specific DNA-adenine methylase
LKKLKPFFCYYGGKWRAAPHYPAPEHDRIIEPFAGAAGYSMRYPQKRVALYEKDPKTRTLQGVEPYQGRGEKG